MKLTEAKIKEAQAVIEAVMVECKLETVSIHKNASTHGNVEVIYDLFEDGEYGNDLAELYINRLHELAGTTPPPF